MEREIGKRGIEKGNRKEERNKEMEKGGWLGKRMWKGELKGTGNKDKEKRNGKGERNRKGEVKGKWKHGTRGRDMDKGKGNLKRKFEGQLKGAWRMEKENGHDKRELEMGYGKWN